MNCDNTEDYISHFTSRIHLQRSNVKQSSPYKQNIDEQNVDFHARATSNTLLIHQQQQIQCDICNKNFSHKWHYETHLISSTSKNFTKQTASTNSDYMSTL